MHSASLAELTALGRARGLPVVDDLGSGAVLDTARYGLAHEPTVQESVAAGVGLVCFSGDKLLGGPQAGLIVGETALVTRLKRHPLLRAVRPDKLTIAALMATLDHYLRDEAPRAVPIWRMIAAPLPELAVRAERWASALRTWGVSAVVVRGESAVGGGSLPDETLPTWLVSVDVPDEASLAARLRAGEPSVIARLERDRLLLDPRTVLPEDDDTLLAALGAAFEALAPCPDVATARAASAALPA